MSSIREMWLCLSVSDQRHFKRAVMKGLNLTKYQYHDRIGERILWDVQERAMILNWFESTTKGKYQLKMSEEFFDLAGIRYPVNL